MTEKAERKLNVPHSSKQVRLNEIQDVLADEGYSADDRKSWLKAVLTELSSAQAESPSEDREQLIKEVRKIIDSNQSGKPLADDVL
ncbi:hypothetical protein [Roseibium salinum]|uniref:Uncharacterized protein n=1 Tax=Roseibium salinum TaxID=1604349 RepID=A0ABT3R4I2_9HYPH|nr:hypothetical protein [Roseibium sp. DSM 29163]MCX2723971.1 hypothetical protein [Roseibium sp. DSM 29163]